MILFFDIFLSKLDTFRVGALIQYRLLGLSVVLNISLMLYIHFSVYKQFLLSLNSVNGKFYLINQELVQYLNVCQVAW